MKNFKIFLQFIAKTQRVVGFDCSRKNEQQPNQCGTKI